MIDDLVAAEQLRQAAGDHVFEQHEVLLVAGLDRARTAATPAAPAPRRTAARARCPPTRLQHRRQVQAAIVKPRAGMAGVDRHRREHREHRLAEDTCRASVARLASRSASRWMRMPAAVERRHDRFVPAARTAGRPVARSAGRSAATGRAARGRRRAGPAAASSPNACSRRPATRTMKNSSRFDAKIARNLTRSSSGFVSFCASSSTRALNSSQLNSRLMKCSGRKVGGLGDHAEFYHVRICQFRENRQPGARGLVATDETQADFRPILGSNRSSL